MTGFHGAQRKAFRIHSARSYCLDYCFEGCSSQYNVFGSYFGWCNSQFSCALLISLFWPEIFFGVTIISKMYFSISSSARIGTSMLTSFNHSAMLYPWTTSYKKRSCSATKIRLVTTWYVNLAQLLNANPTNIHFSSASSDGYTAPDTCSVLPLKRFEIFISWSRIARKLWLWGFFQVTLDAAQVKDFRQSDYFPQ